MPQAALLDKDELARELRDLADTPSLALRGSELHSLAEDVAQEKDLDRWAEVDLLQAFARPESLAEAPRDTSGRPGLVRRIAALPRTRPWQAQGVPRWLRDELRERSVRDGLLEAVLGMLVFVPLLITWIGLREAVRAYGDLSAEHSEQATRPFLQLWQSGFGGHLSPIGRFENVALTAAMLIFLLVVLSGWHSRVRSRAEHDEAARHAKREHDLGRLASTLTRVQMLVSAHRKASPQQFVAELSKAARRMERLAAKADDSHQALVTTGQAAQQATAALESAVNRLGDELPKLGDATTRIEDAVRLGHQAGADASRSSADAAKDLAVRLKAAGDTVEAALTTLTAAQQTLVAKSESVADATDRASRALVDSTGRTGDAIEGMRQATERWDAAAAHWQDAAQRLDEGLRGLGIVRPPAPRAGNGEWHAGASSSAPAGEWHGGAPGGGPPRGGAQHGGPPYGRPQEGADQ
ncbi:hypothetical protein GCM10009801_41850 [Streptomyces albiaxialis]|uniref:Methyl-accepting chemotaxis protein n=1 Tax=Streptomyces albiaxialis TaxID=329523 RepID=A0ABP5HML2_9ACTN